MHRKNYARMIPEQLNNSFSAGVAQIAPALPDELLRLYRQRSKLTQSQLAIHLGFKDRQMVKKWESGYSLPEASRLQKLLEFYLVKGVFLAGKEQAEAQQLW